MGGTGGAADADRLVSVRTCSQRSGAGKIFPEQLVRGGIIPESDGRDESGADPVCRLFSGGLYPDHDIALPVPAVSAGNGAAAGRYRAAAHLRGIL